MKTSRTDQTRTSLWIIAGLILAAAMTRLVPHPPNFTPLGAMSLFAGATLLDRRLALLVPLAALLTSDVLIGQLQGSGFGFYRSQFFVYAAFVMITWMGRALHQHRRSPRRIGAMSLAAATWFFVVSNIGVWLASGMYPPTLTGLSNCFVQAIPFFGNTIAGDLVYATALFGGLALVEVYSARKEGVPAAGHDA